MPRDGQRSGIADQIMGSAGSMNTMERYVIQESVTDAIAILDSAPIRPDLVPQTNAVRLTNRAPIAHLAIEKGLKALIDDLGGTYEQTHSLNDLCSALSKCDQQSADYLADAFDDAVKFFRYNANAKGFRQFRTLDDYLSKVGSKNAFDALRYWAIGEPPKGESPIPYLSLPIHREILCALWCLFLPNRRETVSDRVERKVAHAMFSGKRIAYGADDIHKERSIRWFKNWLFEEQPTCRSALEEAVRRNFAVKDDQFVIQTLRDAYEDLRQSKDPAVLYYIHKLSDLPKGSQSRDPDAVPEVEWFNDMKTAGMVVTPAGTHLGFIERYADGGWGITPSEDGLVQVTDIAGSMTDAKHYLVNRLTRRVTVAVNGELKPLRIVGDEDFFPPPLWTPYMVSPAGTAPRLPKYDLEFWDAQHGLCKGDEISVELQSEAGPGFASVLEGTVTTVAGPKVSIAGMETFMSKGTVES